MITFLSGLNTFENTVVLIFGVGFLAPLCLRLSPELRGFANRHRVLLGLWYLPWLGSMAFIEMLAANLVLHTFLTRCFWVPDTWTCIDRLLQFPASILVYVLASVSYVVATLVIIPAFALAFVTLGWPDDIEGSPSE
jgi:hypothetical protein